MKQYAIAALLVFTSGLTTASPEQTNTVFSRKTKCIISATVAAAATAQLVLINRTLKSWREFWSIIRLGKAKNASLAQSINQGVNIKTSYSIPDRLGIGILLLAPPIAGGYALYQYNQLRKEQSENREQANTAV